jgi:biotin carboxylase
VISVEAQLLDTLPQGGGHRLILAAESFACKSQLSGAVACSRDNDLVERLLVLGAGAGQLGLLAAARSRGLFVIAVDRDPGAPGFRYADRRAIVSVENEPALERLAEAERIDGVIAPGADWPVGAAARIAARLGLPHPISPETAVLSTSKLRQRERLAATGVPQTGWKVLSRPDESIELPALVRPPDRQGRRARSLVRSPRELRSAVRDALRASRIGLALVEELVAEPVVTVTGFCRDGIFHALTVSDRLPLATVWESEHVDGSEAVAQQAVTELGISEGPAVVQLRIGADGPRVLELAARTGGGHDAELCEAALGIDLNALALSAALGETIEPWRLEPRWRAGGACIRFLDGEGEAEGLDEAESVQGVEWVRVYGGSDRAGAVLATGGTAAEALERATRAAECVRFRAPHAHAL